MKYKPVNDMTIEELCRQSKHQRRDDRRKGYLRAVRQIAKFTASHKETITYDSCGQDMHELMVSYEDIKDELNRMEGV